MSIPDFWPPEAEVPQTIKGLIEAAEEAMTHLADFTSKMIAARDKYVNRIAQYDEEEVYHVDPDLLFYIDEVARYALTSSRMSALGHILMIKITERLLPDPEEPFEPGR